MGIITVNIDDYLASDYKIWKQRQSSHLHLKSPITGIVLSDAWTKLPIDTTNFNVKLLGEFTFDDASDTITWDELGNLGTSLPAMFNGSAGLQVTAGLTGASIITLGLFVDDNLILETPLNFSALDRIKDYSANGILVNASDLDLLQSGIGYDFRIKAGTGETPTITLNYFNITIERA